uniref:NACHT domain-containing protein n=1 Tax=Candidatus Kentrum sp. FW TaxID=2126338 RepID=A0A450SRT5_9GAMM|nr:MAG: hypothetical protein BECKFW1821A_GA0114235_106212 [Candidatus Kentron sp. FW]
MPHTLHDNVKNTATIPVGFDYQTLHGVRLLCEWLDSPDRYIRFCFECTDRDSAPPSLDDIVAERVDGRWDYWQIKYTPNPGNNSFTWEWLLHVQGKTVRARSDIRKWFDALKGIDGAALGTARLITNRVPDREIEAGLGGSEHLDFYKAPKDVQERLAEVLDGREPAVRFLSRLQITHSDKGYLRLRNTIENDLHRHTDATGIERLLNRARDWTWFEDQPPPDGWITLDAVRSVISTRRPQPIPQDFTIPDGYRVPDRVFHDKFLTAVMDGVDSIITLTGPPGRGKSTYLSYLCEVLRSKDIPLIRHHYFLSSTDRTHDRLSPYVVHDSLLGQIGRFHYQTGAKTKGDAVLGEALATCAAYYKKEGKPFVVVMDGLDHVWRENASDKEPLDDVFGQLIPTADNMMLIVGTQPVADAQLPDRLVIHSPRPAWKELPPMSAVAVMGYLEKEIGYGRLKPQNDHHARENLAEGAHELHRITQGHPLHVIYATEYLINSGEGLSEWIVQQIPGDLGQDASTYYESLWLRLTFAQRDILVLLAEFSFHWPSNAFTSSALLLNIGPGNLWAVEHLLHRTAAGMMPFHDSLVVFVKGKTEFQERMKALTPNVARWLETEAPARLRNLWLWPVQARLGKSDGLILGLTRDWILDRLIDGYPIDTLTALLTEAEEIAFNLRRYADAYRLRHLKTRLLNGMDFQISDATRLKVCSWKLTQDTSVLDEAVSVQGRLSVVELAGLGVSLQNRGFKETGADCAEKALRRHQGNSRFAIKRHGGYQDWLSEVLPLVRALGTLGFDIGKFNPDAWRLEMLESFVAGASSGMDVGYLIALREKITSPSRRKIIEDAAIRVAALTGAQIHHWTEFRGFTNSSIAGCWLRLVGVPVDGIPHTPFPAGWRDSAASEPLAGLAHEWFFKTILVKLAAEGEFSWVPYPPSLPENRYRTEIPDYLNAMTDRAEQIAALWSQGKPVGFADLYTLFVDLKSPTWSNYDKYSTYQDFCRALNRIALDCQTVSTMLGVPALGSFNFVKRL